MSLLLFLDGRERRNIIYYNIYLLMIFLKLLLKQETRNTSLKGTAQLKPVGLLAFINLPCIRFKKSFVDLWDEQKIQVNFS